MCYDPHRDYNAIMKVDFYQHTKLTLISRDHFGVCKTTIERHNEKGESFMTLYWQRLYFLCDTFSCGGGSGGGSQNNIVFN